MPSRQGNTNRRQILKKIGATGLLLGATGVAAASDGDSPSPESSEVTPEGYWEYDCTNLTCSSGGCVEMRRYCANGDCSGWETTGDCCCCNC